MIEHVALLWYAAAFYVLWLSFPSGFRVCCVAVQRKDLTTDVCVPPASSADFLINSRFFALWNAQSFFVFFAAEPIAI